MMRPLISFVFVLFMIVMFILRVLLWFAIGSGLFGTIIFGLLWLFTHRPNLVPFIVFSFLLMFAAYMVNYASDALAARVRRLLGLLS